MIGPHEGRELELMLAGKKPLAVFHDVVVPGQEIHEDIIPEQIFAPYIGQGKIERIAEDIYSLRLGCTVRHVCFVLPGQKWRAEFFLWYCRHLLSDQIKYGDDQEYIIGGLLGYAADDIAEFIEHKNNIKRENAI